VPGPAIPNRDFQHSPCFDHGHNASSDEYSLFCQIRREDIGVAPCIRVYGFHISPYTSPVRHPTVEPATKESTHEASQFLIIRVYRGGRQVDGIYKGHTTLPKRRPQLQTELQPNMAPSDVPQSSDHVL
jgi:hypothetical protein